MWRSCSAGRDIIGSSGFTLKNSLLYDVGRGVQDEWAGSRDLYIADNVFLGRHLAERMTSWNRPDIWEKWGEFPAPTTSEYAVKVYGQGHVVTRNYVANFHDAITIATYGNPSTKPEEQASSIDIYANDMFNQADNCVELDGGVHNVRAFDNRCVNAAVWGYSTQPIFGGPAYIYRNIMYNGPATGALKLLDNPAGVLVYQNTFIGLAGSLGPLSNVHFRNNLIRLRRLDRSGVPRADLHQLLELGLQRLRAEPGRSKTTLAGVRRSSVSTPTTRTAWSRATSPRWPTIRRQPARMATASRWVLTISSR